MSEALRDSIMANAITAYLERKRSQGLLKETLEKMVAQSHLSAHEVSAEQCIASATNDDQITKDGLDNLAIVKQAEADQFKQDLG